MYSSVILGKSWEIFFLVGDFLYCSVSAENLKTNHNSEKVFFFKWEVEKLGLSLLDIEYFISYPV